MNKEMFQNLAALQEEEDDFQCFSHREESLIKTEK